jgi:threonine dehydrogenase-like Zn-dependent dehydrogenase
VAAIDGSGRFVLLKEDVPALAPGQVLVHNRATLISPGTELGGVPARRQNPNPNAPPRKFGYSSAGIVIATGEGCADVPVGLEVACMGGNYALHSDYVAVPRNLLVPKPERLSFAEAAFAHLGATALHAVRRGDVRLSENVLVVGLGIVGNIALQFSKLAGAHVIAMDYVQMRRDLAATAGADLVLDAGEDNAAKVKQFTLGYGLDCAIIAFGGDATQTVQQISQMMKLAPDSHPMGRLVIVGGANFQTRNWPVSVGNMDIRPSSRPGPGYHDKEWEHGRDYPPVFVQWTTKRNMEETLRFAADGRLKLDMLITHRLPLDDFARGAEELVTSPATALGVILEP